jgi:hypothetical protein
VVATGSLIVWALDEVVRGNPWRRFLGVAVLIYEVSTVRLWAAKPQASWIQLPVSTDVLLFADFVGKVLVIDRSLWFYRVVDVVENLVMMGDRFVMQESLLYEFRLEAYVPADHMLRAIDRFVDLSDLRRHLAQF